jgi:ATP-dependent RNA helicase DDX54/DBP10
MARTGSGKSLAYMIPLVQRFGGRHATVFGARALILLPTRELALQILKVGKELARGWHAGGGTHAGDGKDSEDKKGQSLRWGLIVGGEGLDEQFEMITNNPDMWVLFCKWLDLADLVNLFRLASSRHLADYSISLSK